MNRSIVFRLVIYFAAIMALAVLIGWTAHTSWRRIGDLRQQLSAKQSFEIAGVLQQSILALNNLMLSYVTYHKEDDWVSFSKSSQDLSWWLNEQQPILSSQEEQLSVAKINAAY